MDSKVLKVIARLNRQSNRERSGKAKVAPDQEMLAITADTGIFFSVLLKAIKARCILEVGTSAGYSTLWFADAMGRSHSTRIITIEMNPQKVEWALKNFKEAGLDKMIEIKQGIALDLLRKLKGKFDFVFLDADKENIIRYFDIVLPMLRIGGIIAADNMLYPDHFRPAMRKYARHVQTRPNVQSVTVPIGMGEEITIKLRN
ncbi:MAG: O-methyltransferase [Thermoproteota archaeon]|nr:O-methyltransferase [Thermoproteota archaeon]MDQ5831265.1 O-methyltransferase [Thermoproteota archaeon]